jgi:putative tricarboxylic transport membrane protein
LLLGFVLGPMLEEHLRRAMLFSFGNMSTFVTRPWSCMLLIMALIAFVVVLIPAIAQSRQKVFVE